MTHYCDLHDFSEATGTATLVEDFGLGPILICDRDLEVMGGSAFREQPRPLRFMEADIIYANRRIHRTILTGVMNAHQRIGQLTPSERRQYGSVLDHGWASIITEVNPA